MVRRRSALCYLQANMWEVYLVTDYDPQALSVPQPRPKARLRPLADGEERKRGPAGRTSMYKVGNPTKTL